MEEWRPVSGWEGYYEVSSLGRVRSLDRIQPHRNRWGASSMTVTGRLLRGRIDKDGYRKVSLCRLGEEDVRFVHGLVLEAFSGQRPSVLHQAAHNDGNPANNSVGNLRWATPKSNQSDRVVHHTSSRGERQYAATMSDAVVRLAREEFSKGGITKTALAKKYGVPVHNMTMAILGRTYRHVE